MPDRKLGQLGEDAALEHYIELGYSLLARNWRSGRGGELDLILQRSGLLVICEVKCRSTLSLGTPAEAVTVKKQDRIRRLATRWLQAHPGQWREIRFDVAEVLVVPGGPLKVDLVEAAF